MHCFKAVAILTFVTLAAHSAVDARTNTRHRVLRHAKQAVTPPNSLSFDGPSGMMSVPFTSYIFGVVNRNSAVHATGGSVTPKPTNTELEITRLSDEATPLLFQACMTGHHYPKVTLSMGGATITLGDVWVVQCKVSVDENIPSAPSVDSIGLGYRALDLTIGGITTRIR